MAEDLVLGIDHLKTFFGIAKIGQEIANFAGIISVAVGGSSGRGDAFLACAFLAFIVSACFLILYVTQVASRLEIPWYRLELGFCLLWVLFYIIVSSLVINVGTNEYMAGGIFGFIAVLIYGVEALLRIKIIFFA